MRHKKEHYLEILKVELNDLKEDLELLIQRSRKDESRGRITERVARENIALYENEILGIQQFSRIVHETNPDAFDSLDDMIVHLKTDFDGKVKVLALAQAINVCINRKLDKVKTYVNQ